MYRFLVLNREKKEPGRFGGVDRPVEHERHEAVGFYLPHSI